MKSMLLQRREIKDNHPGMIVLFRIGDCYQAFNEDAETVATLLGLTVTTVRNSELKMTGFPHHSLETYMDHLLACGRTVLTFDQIK